MLQLHDFSGHVQHRAKLPSIEEALRASRAILTTLSERLQGAKPEQLGAQLPHELAKTRTKQRKRRTLLFR